MDDHFSQNTIHNMAATFLRTIAFVGLVLSMYAVFVEYKVHNLQPGEEFTALCDIDALQASCSNVFTLPVGKLLSYFGLVPHDSILDLPNAALGILYYSWILLFIDMPISLLQLAHPMIASAAMASSLFLAYQLTFVLKELCVLCWTTHVINTLLFYKIVLRRQRRQTASVSGTRKNQ